VHAQEVGVQGHGKSDGLQAYIPSFNDVVDNCIIFFKSVKSLILSPLSFCTNFYFLLGDCTLLREKEMCVCVCKRYHKAADMSFFHKVFHELSLLYTLFDMYVVSRFYQY
jgi:hypothetical protein